MTHNLCTEVRRDLFLIHLTSVNWPTSFATKTDQYKRAFQNCTNVYLIVHVRSRDPRTSRSSSVRDNFFLGPCPVRWSLTPILVQDPETGILINADYRISESAWLKPTGNGEDNDKIIQKYRKRISMITGLTMERAEDVQLGNDIILW